jgi:hypothetical protein
MDGIFNILSCVYRVCFLVQKQVEVKNSAALNNRTAFQKKLDCRLAKAATPLIKYMLTYKGLFVNVLHE